ncbi:hypothetical protein AAVH_43681, partial [Aphelenchoides avenae]
ACTRSHFSAHCRFYSPPKPLVVEAVATTEIAGVQATEASTLAAAVTEAATAVTAEATALVTEAATVMEADTVVVVMVVEVT